jgi:hypothetical protein
VTSSARTVPAYPSDTTLWLRGDSTWKAVTSAEGGDITAVNAGTGISGGGTTGAVTVSADTAVMATIFDLASYAPTASPTFTGITTFTTSLNGTAKLSAGLLTATPSDTTGLAAALALKAPLASPSFTGSPVFTLGSDATGDIFYRAAVSGALTRLGIGSTGYRLGVSSGLPAWVASDTTGDAAKFAAKAALTILDDTIAVYTASLLPKSSVGDSIDANTVAVQTSSGYEVRDSSSIHVNGKYYTPQILLASITLDSSVQFTSDTTAIGYVQYKSVIDTIVLYSNSTVSLTPRFLIGSTPAVTSPAAFTTARTATRISTFNASSVAARTMLHLVLDAITTKATKLSVYIYGHPVP